MYLQQLFIPLKTLHLSANFIPLAANAQWICHFVQD